MCLAMKKILLSKFTYLTIGLFILGGWLFSFYPFSKETSTSSKPIDALEPLQASKLLAPLSSLERNDLIQALSGHTKLMAQLINDWDMDAQILEHNGVKNIKRLPADDLLKAQLISRLLHTEPPYYPDQNRLLQQSYIIDDSGKAIKLSHKNSRFYPQTFATASFLLAIVPPQKIIAIPTQLYQYNHLFAWDRLAKIAHRCDDCTGEALAPSKPSLVFVSPYSQPETIQSLQNKGLDLFFLKGGETLKDIHDSLLKIGYATGHALEANLLNLFIEACFLSLDNRFQAIQAFHQNSGFIKKILYIHLDQAYTQPTTKSLTGQLFSRAINQSQGLSCEIPNSSSEWRIPITKEKIAQERPDFVVVSCHLNEMTMIPVLPSVEIKNIFYLDENVQESPTQHIALAYFDIFQIIAAMHLP